MDEEERQGCGGEEGYRQHHEGWMKRENKGNITKQRHKNLAATIYRVCAQILTSVRWAGVRGVAYDMSMAGEREREERMAADGARWLGLDTYKKREPA